MYKIVKFTQKGGEAVLLTLHSAFHKNTHAHQLKWCFFWIMPGFLRQSNVNHWQLAIFHARCIPALACLMNHLTQPDSQICPQKRTLMTTRDDPSPLLAQKLILNKTDINQQQPHRVTHTNSRVNCVHWTEWADFTGQVSRLMISINNELRASAAKGVPL